MAFSIEIRMNDLQLSELIKVKIKNTFSDAFVVYGSEIASEEIRQMSEFVIALYDNRSMNPESSEDIPVFTEEKDHFRYVDCNVLIRKINETVLRKRTSGEYKPVKGRSHILLPFTYVEDREAMISDYFGSLRDEADHVIRIDLMSGLRMPTAVKTGPETGSLTQLLTAASSDDLIPEKILEYCNPDLSGFLTPGRPLDPDDVFDCDIHSIINLLKALQDLSIEGKDPDIASLTVIEGFKISQYRQIVPHCDTVHILLPSMSAESSSGLSDVPGIIKGQLIQGQELIVHYNDNYKRGTVNDKYRIRS